MEKVIIIGAGPAGLTAAIELLKNGGDYDVTILEGSQAMGGISQTVRYNGNRMDIGGHRFFSKNQQVMDWWADLMPLQGKPAYDDKKLGHEKPLAENGPDPETEDNVMLVRDRVSRIYYNKHFFDYPISMKPETIKNMGFVTTMKAGFSYLWACVFKKPETNLENFYINRFGKVLYSMFFEGYTEKLWGRHPSEISADWGSQRVKGLSITALLKDMFKKVFGTKNKGEVETSLIEQFWYPKYGPGQLWETAAEKVKELGGKILTGCQVKKIMCEGRKVTSVVCDTAEGEKTFTGDIFISSMPVKDLILGMDGTKPCDTVIKIAKGLPYRDFVTVGLLVNKLNLKNETNKTRRFYELRIRFGIHPRCPVGRPQARPDAHPHPAGRTGRPAQTAQIRACCRHQRQGQHRRHDGVLPAGRGLSGGPVHLALHQPLQRAHPDQRRADPG